MPTPVYQSEGETTRVKNRPSTTLPKSTPVVTTAPAPTPAPQKTQRSDDDPGDATIKTRGPGGSTGNTTQLNDHQATGGTTTSGVNPNIQAQTAADAARIVAKEQNLNNPGADAPGDAVIKAGGETPEEAAQRIYTDKLEDWKASGKEWGWNAPKPTAEPVPGVDVPYSELPWVKGGATGAPAGAVQLPDGSWRLPNGTIWRPAPKTSPVVLGVGALAAAYLLTKGL